MNTPVHSDTFGRGWSAHQQATEGPRQLFKDFVIERVANRKPLTVLDAGCGSGDLLLEMANIGASHVTGCDANSLCLSQAQNAIRNLPDASCQLVDLTEEWPFTRPFEMVVCNNVVQHFDASQTHHFAGQLYRWTENNGEAIVVTIDEERISNYPSLYVDIGEHLYERSFHDGAQVVEFYPGPGFYIPCFEGVGFKVQMTKVYVPNGADFGERYEGMGGRALFDVYTLTKEDR